MMSIECHAILHRYFDDYPDDVVCLYCFLVSSGTRLFFMIGVGIELFSILDQLLRRVIMVNIVP